MRWPSDRSTGTATRPTLADAHCHLDQHPLLSASAQLRWARLYGVSQLITVGTSLASSAEATAIAASDPDVWAVVGIHPHEVLEATPAVVRQLELLAAHPAVVGVGATGLTRCRGASPAAVQERAFVAQIELSRRTGVALVVHGSGVWGRTLELLADTGPPARVVLHDFDGDPDLAMFAAIAGYRLSFSPRITRPEDDRARAAARHAPLEAVLVESDSPYRPGRGRIRPNEPTDVVAVVETIAALRHVAVEEVAARTCENTREVFALPTDDPLRAVGGDPA